MLRKRKKKKISLKKQVFVLFSDVCNFQNVFLYSFSLQILPVYLAFLWDHATCFDVDLDVFNFFDILFANS